MLWPLLNALSVVRKMYLIVLKCVLSADME